MTIHKLIRNTEKVIAGEEVGFTLVELLIVMIVPYVAYMFFYQEKQL